MLMSRYTENVVLIYDGDEAGQRATQRAIPILEKAGIAVKVLKLRDAKDPDEFLKKFGADRFKLLLEESSNRVEYQLSAIARKYDLKEDEQRIKYIQESAELISTLGSPVQREVYGHRVAEAASISSDVMKMEIGKAFKRRISREKKRQEKLDLAPAQNLQPKSRSIRYDNIKSAMAEETLLAMVLKEPALLAQTKALKPEEFSSPLLGKVYGQLRSRYERGLEISLAVLEDMTHEEMSHVAGIAQRSQGPVNETALGDCLKTIRAEHQAAGVSSADDLLALRDKLKESKGTRA